MERDVIRQRLVDVGIIPVVRAPSATGALTAVEAMAAGGITIAEITLTVPGAIEIIRQLSRDRGKEILVGAGSVLDIRQALMCLDAGAEFVVSPGLDVDTVRAVISRGKVMMAGALTPTEVMEAWRAGADMVKIFPCSAMGGAKYIKALRGPLPQIPLVPTGGVNLQTVAELLEAGAVALGAGGELVDPHAVARGDVDTLTDNARRFAAAVREARAAMEAGRPKPREARHHDRPV